MRCECLMPCKEGPLSEACPHSQAWVLQRLVWALLLTVCLRTRALVWGLSPFTGLSPAEAGVSPPPECVPADKGRCLRLVPTHRPESCRRCVSLPPECVPADKGLLTGHLQSVCDVLHPGVKTLCSVAQLCPTLCNPMDCSLPGSTARWIFQARILKWVAISYAKGSFWPRHRTHIFCISYIGRWVLYHCTAWEAPKFKNKHLEIAI